MTTQNVKRKWNNRIIIIIIISVKMCTYFRSFANWKSDPTLKSKNNV